MEEWQQTDKIVDINGTLVEQSSPTYLSYSIKQYAQDKGLEENQYVVKYYRNGDYYTATVNVEFRINNNLQKGDVVWKVNGKNIDFTTNKAFNQLIQQAEGDTVNLTIKRDGKLQVETVSLFNYGVANSTKVIGITSEAYKFNFGESLVRAVPFTFGLGYKVLESLWMLMTGQLGLDSVGGPITTITTIATFTQSNFASFFIFFPSIIF